ncbi:MAG: hypothetical protein ACLP9L_11315 [Thermoguttaceae bacterium]
MNIAAFNWSNVSSLLGQLFHARAVQDFLDLAGVDSVKKWQGVPIRVVSAKSGTEESSDLADTTEIDLLAECGVRLRFKHGLLLRGLEHVGTEFVFSGITYSSGVEDSSCRRFSGELPEGWKFGDEELRLLEKTGGAADDHGENSDGSFFFDRWNREDLVLQTVFASSNKQLCRVIAFLPLND